MIFFVKKLRRKVCKIFLVIIIAEIKSRKILIFFIPKDKGCKMKIQLGINRCLAYRKEGDILGGKKNKREKNAKKNAGEIARIKKKRKKSWCFCRERLEFNFLIFFVERPRKINGEFFVEAFFENTAENSADSTSCCSENFFLQNIHFR